MRYPCLGSVAITLNESTYLSSDGVQRRTANNLQYVACCCYMKKLDEGKVSSSTRACNNLFGFYVELHTICNYILIRKLLRA